jgi:hypothetical protein
MLDIISIDEYKKNENKFKVEYIPLTKGIWIQTAEITNPNASHKELAQIYNKTITANANKILQLKKVAYAFSHASAIKGGFIGNNAYGISYQKKSVVLNDLLFTNVHSAIKNELNPLTIHFTRSSTVSSKVGIEEFESNGAKLFRTVPLRTFVEALAYCYDNPNQKVLSNKDIINFAKTVGVSFGPNAELEMLSLIGGMVTAGDSRKTIGLTQLFISKAVEQFKSINSAITQLKPNTVDSALLDHKLFFHGKELAEFGYITNKGWSFNAKDTWFAPHLEHFNHLGKLPSLIKNVLTELNNGGVKEEREELRKGRFLGNLYSVENINKENIHIDTLEVSLSDMKAKGEYLGEIKGFPMYTGNIYSAIFSFIKSKENMPVISGCQVKLPGCLRIGENNFELVPADEGKSFTHIVKIAPSGRFESVTSLEWLGMTLAKATGVEVPPFALIDYDTITSEHNEVKKEKKLLSLTDDSSKSSSVDLEELGGGLDFGGGLFDTEIKKSNRVSPPAIMIERFDIGKEKDTKLRIGVEMITVLGKEQHQKNHGSMEEVSAMLKAVCSDWESDRLELFRHTCANYLVCNGDYHLKNMSVLVEFDNEDLVEPKISLSPGYDIVCTPGLGDANAASAWMLITINNSHAPSFRELIDFGVEHCGLDGAFAKQFITDMAQSIMDKMADTLTSMPKVIMRQPLQREAVLLGQAAIIERIDDLGIPVQKSYYSRVFAGENNIRGMKVG